MQKKLEESPFQITCDAKLKLTEQDSVSYMNTLSAPPKGLTWNATTFTASKMWNWQSNFEEDEYEYKQLGFPLTYFHKLHSPCYSR